jgi:26S proteasome regulatory subunit N7
MPAVDPVKKAQELKKQEKLDADIAANLFVTPKLDLVQCRFTLTCASATDEEKEAAKAMIMDSIKELNMGPFYKYICEEYKLPADPKLQAELDATNKAKLVELDATIKEAIEELGETEIREAHLFKAEYLCRIGDKEAAETAFRVTTEKTVSLGQRLDIVLNLIRLGMFYSDKDLTERNFEKAETLMEEGGDWDRRNRLKVYKAVYASSTREFKKATGLFLDTVSTFTCNEIMTYKRFVELTVLMSMFSLTRVDLKKKVVLGPEIQEILHQSPVVKTFLESLVECNYEAFYKSLVGIDELMKKDSVLAPHRKHYIREMRVMGYSQLLQSYRSVTLESMAKSFGVSVDFIDSDIARFVAAGRLNCKIDKVGGIVVTNRPDSKNAQYQASIKQGDLLLNRIQKLSQVINI